MKRILFVTLIVAAGCGLPPNRRLITRVDDYNKAIAFPSDGNPPDIRKIERDFPELKGIVMSAPEYIEEYARLEAEARAKGVPVIPFRIPAGAQIRIDVIGEADLSMTLTVPPTGYYDYPHLGNVTMAQLTIDELKDSLTQKLRKILKRPEVHVNILSQTTSYVTPQGFQQTTTTTSSDIFVFGAVQSSFSTGGVQYTGGQTLIGVLGRTGFPGIAEWRQVRIIRKSPVDPLHKSRVIIADLWNYFALADVRQDVPLFPGDVIYVPLKWSLGDQFQKDWHLVLGYLGDSLFINDYRKQFQPGGAFRN